MALGKITIAGTVYSSVRGVDIDFGVSAVAEGADSDIFPTFVSIRTVTPTITLRGVDLAWATANILKKGQEFDTANSSIFLRKRKAGGTYADNGDPVHIKLTMQGIGVMQTIHDAAGNDSSEVTLQLALYGLQAGGSVPTGNAPLRVNNTAIAIT